jgi:HicB family
MLRRQVFDGDTCQLATRIPQALHRAVKLAALEEDVALQDWVSDALAVYLGELGGNVGTAADEATRKGRAGSAARRARASA